MLTFWVGVRAADSASRWGALAPHSSLLYSNAMRILIATGIYPPEVGGPAYYAQGLGEALKKVGHRVDIVTYGALKKLPMGVRHAAYFLRLLPRLPLADTVIALDTF